MKKNVLMMFVMISVLSISMPAHALVCFSNDQNPECVALRESEARAEFMKREAELMKEKTRILRECASSYPPSWCKNISQH
jgi:hypothetical protein